MAVSAASQMDIRHSTGGDFVFEISDWCTGSNSNGIFVSIACVSHTSHLAACKSNCTTPDSSTKL